MPGSNQEKMEKNMMLNESFSSFELGKKIAELEKTIASGDALLPIIVIALQSNFTLGDYGLFFEGYNSRMEV